MGAKTARCLLAAIVGCLAIAVPAAAATSLPTGFRDGLVLSELPEPTALRFSPDGTKVFLAEKVGRIVVYDGLGDTTPTLFADLRTQVYDAADRGLLGLAVDPAFRHLKPGAHVLAVTAFNSDGVADPTPVVFRWRVLGRRR